LPHHSISFQPKDHNEVSCSLPPNGLPRVWDFGLRSADPASCASAQGTGRQPRAGRSADICSC